MSSHLTPEQMEGVRAKLREFGHAHFVERHEHVSDLARHEAQVSFATELVWRHPADCGCQHGSPDEEKGGGRVEVGNMPEQGG